MSKYIQSQFRKQNNAGHGFDPEGVELGEFVNVVDGLKVYDRNGYITAVGDVHGPWAVEIPSPTEAIDEAFKGWDGFAGWSWDVLEETLASLQADDLDDLASEMVYMVSQDGVEILEEDAVDWLKENKARIIEELTEELG